MPSRSRSPSAVSSSQEPQPKRPYQPVVYDPNFADEGLDLTLRTLDGISFSLLRSTLAIHLPTFAAMLPPPPSAAALLSPQQLLPTTTPSSSSRARSVGEVDDLNGSTSQLVDLHELSVPFGLLLRYAIPGKYLDLEGNPPKFPSYRFFAEIVVLENTLELAHRYQLPLVFDVISKIQLAILNQTSPLRGFAIAARFNRLEDARESIKGLCHRKFVHPGARKWMVETGTFLEGYRDACLGDLALATLVYVPMSSVRNFMIVHSRVVASQDGSYTWLDAAKEFNLW